MKVRYENAKLERSCTDERAMQRAYGLVVSKQLKRRIAELRAASRVDDLFEGVGKWEYLTADRAGEISARVSANYRLIIRADDDECVVIIDIVDYH